MNVRQMGTAWLVAAALLVVMTGLVGAQSYDTDLPPGVESVSIAGASIDGSTTPVLSTTTPTISGMLTPGPTTAEFVVRSTEQQWTVMVDAQTGAFETIVPNPLDPGTHSLYINDALVGQFVVAQDATENGEPVSQLPSTGTGVNTSNALGTSAASLAVLALIAVGGSAGIRRRACR